VDRKSEKRARRSCRSTQGLVPEIAEEGSSTPGRDPELKAGGIGDESVERYGDIRRLDHQQAHRHRKADHVFRRS
jgi:hypothetical protein